MKKNSFLVLLIIFLMNSNLKAEEQWKSLRGDFSNVNFIAASEDSSVVYAGTDRFVFATRNNGLSWNRVLSVKGDNTRVNFILEQNNDLLVATGNGLYRSLNRGKTWQIVFKGKDELERNCLCVIKSGEKYLLGTQAGIFFSNANLRWQKVQGEISNKEILYLANNAEENNILYALSPNILYRSKDSGESWVKIFSFSGNQDNEIDETVFTDTEEIAQRNLQSLAVSRENTNEMYLATKNGLLISSDGGTTWDNFYKDNLPKVINCILLASRQIYLATNQGVFKFAGENWQNIYKGVPDKEINWLITNSNYEILAAAKLGVFKLAFRDQMTFLDGDESGLVNLLAKEPTIQEIQKVAIIYNDLDNKKIQDWRRRMRLRGLMPQISLDYDKTVGYSSSTTSGGTYASFIGPRDVSLGLKWDVAELVWNSYEDDIDSRARYMVQLRDDILDEITRIYFEIAQ